LKGKGEIDLPEALIFEMGSNVWRKYDVWPPVNAVTKTLYLQQGEGASFTPPGTTGEKGFESFVSDPDRPVPHDKDQIASWGYDFMHDDQRFAARRPDVLVFQTEPLEETFTIAGPIEADLYVSTTGTDADWVVKVIDVFPDSTERNSENTWMGGYQMLVRGDIIRGKFRNSFERPEPFIPGEVTRVAFTLPDVSHAFLPGHRIMIQVQSSWFPLVDRNPQKFMNIYEAEETDFQKAMHRVYFTTDHPSGVQFHVVK
jgi:putative CocE/NonD family hydrolase